MTTQTDTPRTNVEITFWNPVPLILIGFAFGFGLAEAIHHFSK